MYVAGRFRPAIVHPSFATREPSRTAVASATAAAKLSIVGRVRTGRPAVSSFTACAVLPCRRSTRLRRCRASRHRLLLLPFRLLRIDAGSAGVARVGRQAGPAIRRPRCPLALSPSKTTRAAPNAMSQIPSRLLFSAAMGSTHEVRLRKAPTVMLAPVKRPA